jgi:hypothetical protein
MSVASEFYLARADENMRDAESATLDNVRDRCRRSEAAWRLMAERVIRSETMRTASASAKVSGSPGIE